jgi:hypothetical protein
VYAKKGNVFVFLLKPIQREQAEVDCLVLWLLSVSVVVPLSLDCFALLVFTPCRVMIDCNSRGGLCRGSCNK